MYVSYLSQLAVTPQILSGSFMYEMFAMCDSNFGAVLEIALGNIEHERVQVPQRCDGFLDTLKFLLNQNSPVMRRLLRLPNEIVLRDHV